MPVDFETLRDAYFIRSYDPDFAAGRRSHLIYALPSLRLSCTHLNRGGPEPLTYLEYARRDIAGGTQQGAINALGNAKRAVHLVIDALLQAYGLGDWDKAPFPVRAELLRDLGALPTRMVSRLNSARNLMEHDYAFVEVDVVSDFVELVELFLTVAYPFFKGGVIGAYVGTEQDTRCEEWFIDPTTPAVAVAEVPVDSYLRLPGGRVHYNMERQKGNTPRRVIPLVRSRQSEWMSYLDLFFYCSRRETFRLKQDSRGPGVYYQRSLLSFSDESGCGRTAGLNGPVRSRPRSSSVRVGLEVVIRLVEHRGLIARARR